MPYDTLIIERGALGDPLTHRIRELFCGAVETVDDARPALEREPGENKAIVLMRYRGRFVKDFPVPGNHPPCGEKYIVTMQGCPYGCTYCYLQSYLGHGNIAIFTNTASLADEIAHALSNDPPAMMTTGELGDSLALDPLTGTVSDLLPLFRGTGTALEIRTKSARIDHLLAAGAVKHCSSNLVLTWTLGPERAVALEEPGTATLGERLDAIAQAARAGLRIGIRFDPIIPAYADTASYECLVDALRASVSPGDIHRFELGVVRFPSNLLGIIRGKYPRSPLLRGEYIRDREGKTRLYRPIRLALYRSILGVIRGRFPSTPVELSMEEHSVWEDAGLA